MKAIIEKLRNKWENDVDTNAAIGNYLAAHECEIMIEAADELLALLKPCVWTWNKDGEYWVTSCEEMFDYAKKYLSASGMKYCPYCSGEIEEAK